MADTLTLKEVELDYEADEVEDRSETPPVTPRDDSPIPGAQEPPSTPPSLIPSGTDDICSPVGDEGEEDEPGEIEEGEELEDGEISDEDETLKNERLEPKPVCRFFSKGQCTWGQSCRFLHPGVLDKGNYSMFAAPRPILPGEPDVKEPVVPSPEKQVMAAPPVPAYESAWERGLRQAKEMRRRSNKRREMDVEYEEKKASLSLTQVELDKENDYYMRPASPAHTHDPYAEDYDPPSDPYDTYHPESSRRIAPPPPPDFIAREERERSSRYTQSPPPPRVRRIAPPRSPDPTRQHAPSEFTQPNHGPPPPPSTHQTGRTGGRFRGGEDWADPWMRGGQDKPKVGGTAPGRSSGGRRRSYSSGSSRSSSGSSRSRSRGRRRRYSNSSYSSHSSSRSRSRSSTPPSGIPKRGPDQKKSGGGSSSSSNLAVKREPSGRTNTAPLQKRLAAVAGQTTKVNKPGGRVQGGTENRRHEDREGKRRRNSNSDEGAQGGSSRSSKTQSKSRSGVSEPGVKKEARPTSSGKELKQEKPSKPKEPFKMNLPKNQIKLTLKAPSSTKPVNQTVLEKLGMTNDDLAESKKAMKRKADLEQTEAGKKQKIANLELMEALKERLKSKVELTSKIKPADKPKLPNEEETADPEGEADKDPKKAKAKAGGGDAKGRREELLKQLKAVEDAIHRKRTKLDG